MTKKLTGLYAITHETLMPEAQFLSLAEAAICGGISILQYRDKSSDKIKKRQQASALKKMCTEHNVTFIINDDIELTMQVDADGIHIGKNDLDLNETRKHLGPNKIIGVSCYNQLSLAKTAAIAGANYIAFGSFFGSTIKPDAPAASIELIQSFKQTHNTPLCCIGGITHKNFQSLTNAGADMVAVISDIFSEPSTVDVARACRKFI